MRVGLRGVGTVLVVVAGASWQTAARQAPPSVSVAGAQLRNKDIALTQAALVGKLVYIAFRVERTNGAAAEAPS